MSDVRNDPAGDLQAGDKLPTAKVTGSRWNFPIVWVVPLVAAIVAGYVVVDRVRESGPAITIQFKASRYTQLIVH